MIVNRWMEHPKSQLTTNNGIKVRHVQGRKVRYEATPHRDLIVDDKGNLTEDGSVDSVLGRLSPELVDVTEQLRIEWLSQRLHSDELNPYEERQRARRDRYLARADRAKDEGNSAYLRATAMLDMIPLGQPILVGHHSENRHRSTLNKADGLFRKAFVECDAKAAHYQNKADGVGLGGISSDDPEAVRKLKENLQNRIQTQERMKACNQAIKKGKSEGAQIAGLVALGLTDKQAQDLVQPDFCGRIGFASYSLQNNNAEINRLKKRIAQLEVVRESTKDKTEIFDSFRFEINSSENRVMFFFDGKPAEAIRLILKSFSFIWSPRRMAWVRKITPNALFDAQCAKAKLKLLDATIK